MARSEAGSTPQRKNRRRGTDIRRPAAFLFRRAWIWGRLMTDQAAARADGMLEDQDALGENDSFSRRGQIDEEQG